MSETWLHTNRRALALALVLPVVGLLCGLLLLAASPRVGAWAWWLDIVMTGLWTVLSAMLLSMLRKPRIARRGDQMLFYLRLGAPFPVPLELVEGFLLGQGASYLRKSQPGAFASFDRRDPPG